MQELEPLSVPLSGSHLIEASAGTGKTYTITTLFLRLVIEQKLPVQRILVVTFTKAATAELRERIRNRIHRAHCELEAGESADALIIQCLSQNETVRKEMGRRLHVALRDFEEAPIFTIHGFCQRVLDEQAFETGSSFDAEIVTDESALHQEILADFWAQNLYEATLEDCEQLEAAGLSMLRSAKLVRRTVGVPNLEIVPSAEHDESAKRRYLDTWQKARALWAGARTDIEECLLRALAAGDLKRTTYKPEKLPVWFEELDAYFEPQDQPCSPVPMALSKLTAAALNKGVKKGCLAPEHNFFAVADALWDERDGFEAILRQFQRELLNYVRSERVRRQFKENRRSYDDLLQALAEAIEGDGGTRLVNALRTRYGAALIDEFQDTDPIQYRIFRAIYGQTNLPLFLIGDPKQSIYAFRGADVFAYLMAARDMRARAYTMRTNWRSDPGMIQAVNHLFMSHPQQRPFVSGEIKYFEIGAREGARDALTCKGKPIAPFWFCLIERSGRREAKKTLTEATCSEADVATLLASDMRALLDDGVCIDERPLRASDIAVLVRSNLQAQLVQQALRNQGIDSVLQSTESVMASEEARELHWLMEALAELSDVRALKRALSISLFGLSAAQIDALDEDDDLWACWITQFRLWQIRWASDGLACMFRDLMHGSHRALGMAPVVRLLGFEDGDRRVTNFLQLGELLQQAEREHHLGVAGLVRWLSRERLDSNRAKDGMELRLESDAPAVQITTVHRSKGLEYGVVYCPYLYKSADLRPDERAQILFHDASERCTKLDLGSPDRKAHLGYASEEAQAESMRLLYVALTRAKHMCLVFWGGFTKALSSSLGHLIYANETRSMAKITDAELAEVISELTQRSAGAIAHRSVVEGGRHSAKPAGNVLLPLVVRQPQRRVLPRWRRSSFSNLVVEPNSMIAPATAQDGVDYDDGADDPVGVFGVAVHRHVDEQPGWNREIVLGDFERGRVPGHCIHAIFEELDFEAESSQRKGAFGCAGDDGTWPRNRLEDLVAAKLRQFGLYSEDNRILLCRAIEDALVTPLDEAAPGLKLESIAADQRLNELEFVLPVAWRGEAHGSALTCRRLRGVFCRHAETDDEESYAHRMGDVSFAALRGYLKGFIDMVFQWRERWYVADYKSNTLGEQYADYNHAAMSRAMLKHHYYLQYHLYVVALHRYLRYRLPDYRYDDHMGRVYYLFIKGMSPETGGETGVWRARPSQALIEDLSKVLEGDDV